MQGKQEMRPGRLRRRRRINAVYAYTYFLSWPLHVWRGGRKARLGEWKRAVRFPLLSSLCCNDAGCVERCWSPTDHGNLRLSGDKNRLFEKATETPPVLCNADCGCAKLGGCAVYSVQVCRAEYGVIPPLRIFVSLSRQTVRDTILAGPRPRRSTRDSHRLIRSGLGLVLGFHDVWLKCPGMVDRGEAVKV